MSEAVSVRIEAPTGWVVLDRSERHNAFDDTIVAGLSAALERLAADGAVRVVGLRAEGKSFSAGADLAWMGRMAEGTAADNLADARLLAAMLRSLADLPKPTIARVQGPAYGGGVGLIAACDIAVAVDSATFALSEVRLGLIPSVIAPHVVAAMGARQARRYMLTAERFSAAEAMASGLIHQVVSADDLDEAVGRLVRDLACGGPRALDEAKALVRAVAGRPMDAALIDDTAQRIARVRASAEGREGVAAFLEKRPPAWRGR